MEDLLASINILIPTILFWTISRIIVRFSTYKPKLFRIVAIFVIFLLIIRYLIWRILNTLNLSTTLSSIASIFLLVLEIVAWILPNIELFLSVNLKQRSKEADRMEIAVINGEYNPSVDIFIVTLNESVDILKRTIVGCQAINYKRKKIYVLDDGRREEIKQLTKLLGCQYITRNNNKYAKGGNLNNALKFTNGELIVVFDADFVPCTNFLTRTVGFFQRPNMALLQTYLHYYNSDIIAKNLGLENFLNNTLEEFSARQNQPTRDYYNGVMCYGSSFLVRRSYLEKIGGFYTDSIAEDYYTSVSLLAKGHQIIYLSERLSAGLVPEDIPSLFIQRTRWAQGTIQGFFVDANPLSIRGLNKLQRIIYLTGIINWFTNINMVLFLLLIPLCFTLNIIPFSINASEWIYYFFPLYIFQMSIFFWLNDRCSSKFVIDIYNFVLCIPVSVAIIRTLIAPFKKSFQVTPKGVSRNQPIFHWHLALPLIGIWLITGFSCWICAESVFNIIKNQSEFIPELGLGLFWNSYYLVMISVAILAFIDVPQPDSFPWLTRRKRVNLIMNKKEFKGYTSSISEIGAIVELNNNFDSLDLRENLPIELEFIGEELNLAGKITKIKINKQFIKLKITFESVKLEEYRNLVKMLFCMPGIWQAQKVPGEFKSIFLLLKSLVKPRFLFNSNFK